MTFNELYLLCIKESRTFVGDYELDIDKLRTLLDKHGRIKIVDKNNGRDSNFEKNNIEPIVKFLKDHGEDVSVSLSRHDFFDGYQFFIKRIPPAIIEPELEPWETAKKRLEKQRIDRGFAHSGKRSTGDMIRKVSRQKTIGQPIDNTYGYGKKDSKGKPLWQTKDI